MSGMKSITKKNITRLEGRERHVLGGVGVLDRTVGGASLRKGLWEQGCGAMSGHGLPRREAHSVSCSTEGAVQLRSVRSHYYYAND